MSSLPRGFFRKDATRLNIATRLERRPIVCWPERDAPRPQADEKRLTEETAGASIVYRITAR
jgi:hypothetical protein